MVPPSAAVRRHAAPLDEVPEGAAAGLQSRVMTPRGHEAAIVKRGGVS